MPEHADVRSVEAIKQFRAHLANYVAKAGAALDEVHEEVVRTRLWLEGEQRAYWQGHVRRSAQALEEAERALFRARLPGLRESVQGEQLAVNRAKGALQRAEAKLARVRGWARAYDDRVLPVEKGLGTLRTTLDSDMPRALASLAQTIDNLEAYRSVAGPATVAGRGESDGGDK